MHPRRTIVSPAGTFRWMIPHIPMRVTWTWISFAGANGFARNHTRTVRHQVGVRIFCLRRLVPALLRRHPESIGKLHRVAALAVMGPCSLLPMQHEAEELGPQLKDSLRLMRMLHQAAMKTTKAMTCTIVHVHHRQKVHPACLLLEAVGLDWIVPGRLVQP